MSKNTCNEFVAERLRALRRRRGWSLDETTLRTSISKSMLGQIERSESSPTVTTLFKLAEGFDVSLATFFPEKELEIIDPDEQVSGDGRRRIKTIFPLSEDVDMEIYEVRLYGPDEHISMTQHRDAVEHIIVISGAIKLLFGGKWQKLGAGEVIRLRVDRAYAYAAISATAIFQNIVYYP